MSRVMIVRPYGPRIRSRVFALLRRVGLLPEDRDVLVAGTPDQRVVDILRLERPDVLVIPFHVHRDESGREVNGIDLAELLHRALPARRHVPVLMPVSLAALPAARLRLSPEGTRGLSDGLRSRLLPLDEESLDAETTAETVRGFLSGSSAPGS